MKRKLSLVLLVIGLCFFIFLQSCFWAGKYLIINHPPEQSDVIITLGNPANDNGKPGTVMKSRVDKALELFHENYAPYLIFTGSSVTNEFIEAEVMSDYAQHLSVSPNAIIEEPKAKDTFENVKYSAEIMQQNRWETAIAVTSPYHTKRVFVLFSKLGIDVCIVAAEFPSNMKWFHHIEQILHEYVAFIVYKFQGKL